MSPLSIVRKKLLILLLQIIKMIVPSGIFITIQIPSNVDYKFFLDKETDNGFILGFYENELVQSLYTHLAPGDVFYDLGSAWGYFSLLASRLVGERGIVYSFEPLKTNFERATSNFKINKIKNINCYENAIADFDGEVIFSTDQNAFANSYKLESLSSGTRVPCYKLDTLVFDKSYEPPMFIKIDVEGAEFDVLKGSLRTIQKYRPIVHLSIHEFFDNSLTRHCTNYFVNLNYNSEILTKKDGITDYLFTPLQ